MGTPPTFTDGTVVNAAALAFALDPPRGSVSADSGSFADDVSTAVTFSALKWDTDGMWDAGNPTRLTVRTPGLYQVSVLARMPTALYGRLDLNLRANAGGVAGSGTSIFTYTALNATVTGTANGPIAANFILDQPVPANDYFEVFLRQKSGATRTLDAAYLFLRWVAYI